MHERKSNVSILLAALKICSSLRNLERGKKIHADAIRSRDDSNMYVANSLVYMYAKCGSMVDARLVFDGMPRHNVISWTTLMLGYVENGESQLALQLFVWMAPVAPNARTFSVALKACTILATQDANRKFESLRMGLTVHCLATKSGCYIDVFLQNNLIDMYAKCGSMEDSRAVFDRMLRHDVISWTALILGYAENGEGDLALQMFDLMLRKGYAPDAQTFVVALKTCTSLAANEETKQVDGKLIKVMCMQKSMAIHKQAARSNLDADIYLASTIVDAYAKGGSMVDAQLVFDRMPRRNVVSWTALILGYVDGGQPELALKLFRFMVVEGFAPDARTFVAALRACGNVAAYDTGQQLHTEICKCSLEHDIIVTNCLVDFYGKCGDMLIAQKVFDSVASRDTVTWSTLITGYSHQGDTKNVFDLFQRMRDQGFQPNEVTFLSILTACSHAGLVSQGKRFFHSMYFDYGITPCIEHYRCVVDILGRANQLDEALQKVRAMPFKPDVMTWMTVLGACRKWSNIAVGKTAFGALLRLDEKHDAAYALMSNIYGAAGMWEEQLNVQIRRKNAGGRALMKLEQALWTDSKGVVHTFDSYQPQSEILQARLELVSRQIAELGFSCFLPNNSRDESVLCGHSEKLAVVCALVNTTSKATIRIVKNLSVCDDCHKFIALTSLIEHRHIICRDNSHCHVMSDGKCNTCAR